MHDFGDGGFVDRACDERIPLGAVVTRDYLFDFLIMYHSLLESWAFYRFTLHAFVYEPEVAERLSELDLPEVVVHFHADRPDSSWRDVCRWKPLVVEHSGLERCIYTDVDVLWLAETPELYLLLDDHDLVFTAGPAGRVAVQSALWSFRRNERSVAFARNWHRLSQGHRLAETTGLAHTLVEHGHEASLRILCRPEPRHGVTYYPSPYCVSMHVPHLRLSQEETGFREQDMGKAKLVHFATLRGQGGQSVEARLEVLATRFRRAAPVFPLYAELANRAAQSLGMETFPKYAEREAELLQRGAAIKDAMVTRPRRERPKDQSLRELVSSARYADRVTELADAEPVAIGAVVRGEDLLAVCVLYQSLVNSWTSVPFCLHAFMDDPEAAERLRSLRLPHVEVRLIDGAGLATSNPPHPELIEHGGLERCIVVSADNVFVAETPELQVLLDRHDVVLAGSPLESFPARPRLWAYRRNDRSLRFAHAWRELLHAERPDGSLREGLADRCETGSVRVLTRLPEHSDGPALSPYDFRLDLPGLRLEADAIGFRDDRMGRAKVLSLGDIASAGRDSPAARLEAVAARRLDSGAFLGLYARLVNRAAALLGRSTPDG